MEMDSFVIIVILGPFTFAAMVSTSIYMKVQARRLSAEILKKGLVVHALPIFVTGRVSDEPRPPLISPMMGIPPPPPYTRTAPVEPQALETSYPSGPPPAYSSGPGYGGPDGSGTSLPAYEMTQVETVNELNQPVQRSN